MLVYLKCPYFQSPIHFKTKHFQTSNATISSTFYHYNHSILFPKSGPFHLFIDLKIIFLTMIIITGFVGFFP